MEKSLETLTERYSDLESKHAISISELTTQIDTLKSHLISVESARDRAMEQSKF